jgi:hypothetical protein
VIPPPAVQRRPHRPTAGHLQVTDPGQMSLRYSRDFVSIRSTMALAWGAAFRWRSGGRA